MNKNVCKTTSRGPVFGRSSAGFGEFEQLPAAVVAALDAMSGKWKLPVIWLLWLRGRRFGELRRGLPGVTQHMLTATLRELEADGLVTRTVHADRPLRVQYALTDSSLLLCDVFAAMARWGESRLSRSPSGRAAG